MVWKDYSKLKGTHAVCGASNYSWRNYDPEKLIQRLIANYAAPIGTALHEYAADNIKNKIKLLKTDKHGVLRYLLVEKKIPSRAIDIDMLFPNLMNYVNDSIGFRLDPEVVLYYSPYSYGTADAISWANDTLQISDLKTGVVPASFAQLENYAAFFCLDYKIHPSKIKEIIFRIYQGGQIAVAKPDPSILVPIMEQIVEFNKIITDFEEA